MDAAKRLVINDLFIAWTILKLNFKSGRKGKVLPCNLQISRPLNAKSSPSVAQKDENHR